MEYCPKCGFELESNQELCPKCGIELASFKLKSQEEPGIEQEGIKAKASTEQNTSEIHDVKEIPIKTFGESQKKPKGSKAFIILLSLATLACVGSLFLAINKPKNLVEKEAKTAATEIEKLNQELTKVKENKATDDEAKLDQMLKETTTYKEKTKAFNDKAQVYTDYYETTGYQVMEGLNNRYRNKDSNPEDYASDGTKSDMDVVIGQLKRVGLYEEK